MKELNWINAAVVASALALAMVSAAGANAAPAKQSAWVEGPEGRVRLESGADAKGLLWLGLTFDLKPGWKIFWRSPGAPGLPPQLDWAGSSNLRSAQIVWPAPTFFTSFGFKARGFGGRVILPIRVRRATPGKPVTARVHVRYQVCKDVCIPGEARLSLTATGAAGKNRSIAAALSRVPKPVGANFGVWKATRDGGVLTVLIRHRRRQLSAPVMVIEAPRSVRLGRTGPVVRPGDGLLQVKIPILRPKAEKISRFSVRVTLISGNRAWEKTVPVSRSAR